MSSSSRSGDLVEEVEYALEALFRLGANRRFDADQDAAVGERVTRAGYAVLRSLTAADALGLGELAGACVMDAATASRQVDRLVALGLVTRRVAQADARAVQVSITDRGRSVYRAVVEHRLAFVDTALSSWTDEELGQLAVLIQRVTNDLGAAALGR